jgi:hypothetical protein
MPDILIFIVEFPQEISTPTNKPLCNKFLTMTYVTNE